jgi:hypothetical protein
MKTKQQNQKKMKKSNHPQEIRKIRKHQLKFRSPLKVYRNNQSKNLTQIHYQQSLMTNQNRKRKN